MKEAITLWLLWLFVYGFWNTFREETLGIEQFQGVAARSTRTLPPEFRGRNAPRMFELL